MVQYNTFPQRLHGRTEREAVPLPPENERKVSYKKRIASFAGGFLAALALPACLITVLAASGIKARPFQFLRKTAALKV